LNPVARITHVGESRFDAVTASGHTMRLEGGDHTTGPGAMEMTLVALGTCSSITVVSLLNKMRQPFTSFDVEVSGERATTAPMVWVRIHVGYRVGGEVDPRRVERAIDLTETKYCSVWTMLSKTAEMTNSIAFI